MKYNSSRFFFWVGSQKQFVTMMLRYNSTRTRVMAVTVGKALTISNASVRCYKDQNIASPGNRTRVARMGILHDTTTPATRFKVELVIQI